MIPSFINDYQKASGEYARQQLDKLKGKTPEQITQMRQDAFRQNQLANEQSALASDPNRSKGMDPFQRAEMLDAPNKASRDALFDVLANMDKYSAAADARAKKNAGNATVNYTNPGTGSVPATPTAPPVTPTTPAAPLRRTSPRRSGTVGYLA